MRQKSKAIKSVIKEDVICDGEYRYIYRLYENAARKIGKASLTLYSIEIEMECEEVCSKSEISEIFADVGKALTFYNSLVENLVTPINLHYVLEDSITLITK